MTSMPSCVWPLLAVLLVQASAQEDATQDGEVVTDVGAANFRKGSPAAERLLLTKRRENFPTETRENGLTDDQEFDPEKLKEFEKMKQKFEDEPVTMEDNVAYMEQQLSKMANILRKISQAGKTPLQLVEDIVEEIDTTLALVNMEPDLELKFNRLEANMEKKDHYMMVINTLQEALAEKDSKKAEKDEEEDDDDHDPDLDDAPEEDAPKTGKGGKGGKGLFGKGRSAEEDEL